MGRATLRVLSSSVINAISGWFRLYIVFLFVGKTPDLILCFAASFVVYSVYTLDRALKSKEDEVNRPEVKNANKIIIFPLLFVFLFTAFLILEKKNIPPVIALFPFIIGFLYTKGLRICSVSIKFKQGLGVKNFVVAFTWAFTTSAFIFNFVDNYLQIFSIFVFIFFKSFINTVIFDCKDIEGDSMAGIVTIPVRFGERKTRIILQALNSSFHLAIVLFVLLGFVRVDGFILFYSWTASLIYIFMYSNSKKTIFRSVIVHGEYTHMLAFRNLAVQFSRNAFQSS